MYFNVFIETTLEYLFNLKRKIMMKGKLEIDLWPTDWPLPWNWRHFLHRHLRLTTTDLSPLCRATLLHLEQKNADSKPKK